jgi:hypothetical protein
LFDGSADSCDGRGHINGLFQDPSFGLELTRSANTHRNGALLIPPAGQLFESAKSVRHDLVIQLAAHTLIGAEHDCTELPAGRMAGRDGMHGHFLQCHLKPHFYGSIVGRHRAGGAFVLADIYSRQSFHGLDDGLKLPSDRDGTP